jgi:hypothetical protein
MKEVSSYQKSQARYNLVVLGMLIGGVAVAIGILIYPLVMAYVLGAAGVGAVVAWTVHLVRVAYFAPVATPAPKKVLKYPPPGGLHLSTPTPRLSKKKPRIP